MVMAIKTQPCAMPKAPRGGKGVSGAGMAPPARILAKEISLALEKIGLKKEADQVAACGQVWLVRSCNDCKKTDPNPRPLRCKRHALCPDCARIRANKARKILNAAMDQVESGLHCDRGRRPYEWKLITFTVPHSLYVRPDGSRDIGKAEQLIKNAWRQVWRDGARPGKSRASLGYTATPGPRGGLKYKRRRHTAAHWSVEVSGSLGSEHVHMHVLYFGPFVVLRHDGKHGSRYPHITRTWARAIGAKGHLAKNSPDFTDEKDEHGLFLGMMDPDVRKVDRGSVPEAAKYASKGLGYNGEAKKNLAECAAVAVKAWAERAGRCFGFVGWLYELKMEKEPLCCEFCGSADVVSVGCLVLRREAEDWKLCPRPPPWAASMGQTGIEATLDARALFEKVLVFRAQLKKTKKEKDLLFLLASVAQRQPERNICAMLDRRTTH